MATIAIGGDTMKEKEQQVQQPSNGASGFFCNDTGIYCSKFKLNPHNTIPSEHDLDVASFVLSRLPPQHISEIKPALIDSATGSRVSYSQLRRCALSLAAALHHGLGLRKGDVVVLLSPNFILYPAICLGILACGAVLNPASPLSTCEEVSNQALRSGAKLAISAPEEVHKLKATGIPILITNSDSTSPSTSPLLLSVEELMEGGDLLEAPTPAGLTQSDVAALFYSSAESKGVLLTHGNLIAMSMLIKWGVELESSSAAEDMFLCGFLPMSSIYGLAFFVLGLPCVGSTTVIMSDIQLNHKGMMEAAEKHRINNILAVPPVLSSMNNSYYSEGRDLSMLRRVGIMNTGSPMAMGVTMGKEFRRRFPWAVLREGYGMTEVSGPATVFASEVEARDRVRSVGQLLPELEGRVVEVKSGRAVGPGAVGELWLRGPTVIKAEDDGWLKTGDLAYFDEDGFLYIVDRIKDLIQHNGYQVSPAELEAILVAHPQILDAAVIPIPDERAEQVPMAYVVRSAAESTLTSEEVIQFVANQVAPYKKLKKVAFVNAIPKSAAGKILRKQLAAQNKQAIPAKL